VSRSTPPVDRNLCGLVMAEPTFVIETGLSALDLPLDVQIGPSLIGSQRRLNTGWGPAPGTATPVGFSPDAGTIVPLPNGAPRCILCRPRPPEETP
jgi:hypothetical protein